jgi:SAM-dependent methyltransferase
LVELAGVSQGAAVLDIATGRGAALKPALERAGLEGYVVGVDLSTGMLRRTAADLVPTCAGVCQMDVRQLGFARDTFDRVVCGHSIFYFPDAIGEFHRVLKSGGKLGLSIIAAGCFDWLWDAFNSHPPPADSSADDEDGPEEAPIDTPGGLVALLHRGGFEAVRVAEETAEFVYTDEDEFWMMLWTLGLRGRLEEMEFDDLESLKGDLFSRLEEFGENGGIRIRFRVLYALGRPGRAIRGV